ncbi:LysM peptidoglycan-binding domain-containing protein [Paenibacillus tengchongensis]|uniref:LysM peptidoglycan-binding domain-containing protein n=1 Tax=Paenibacillus tengchongensis TaxID=2608684 RepID=UPI00124EA0E7|nr:LysM peptidoglycan-binding domain-containing protein [Paenibacillus tengchongensis]
MFDPSHGLRFDIYERIHLSEELPGIAELEEVELIPDIQVIQREDRAELYGQLLLTGLYRGENDRTERLEHAIPVEITVPLTRVRSLEEIGVEIENFDIDLLTMRTVNITGILSLRGIGTGDSQPAWQQEEYTVAYSPADEAQAGAGSREADQDALYENSVWTFGEGTAETALEEKDFAGSAQEAGADAPHLESAPAYTQPAAFTALQQKDSEKKIRTHSLDSPPWQTAGIRDSGKGDGAGAPEGAPGHTDEVAGTLQPEQAQYPAENDAVPEEVAVIAAEEAVAETQSPDYGVPAAEDTAGNAGPASIPEEPQLPEEKPDLKIALGTKKDAGQGSKESLTFSSLLGTSRTRKDYEAPAAEEAPQAIQPAAAGPGSDNDWKSRFISSAGGAELFRKVRLCIVQREDTLDTIAEKYHLSVRELSSYNRLSGQNVEEGQVLYIP